MRLTLIIRQAEEEVHQAVRALEKHCTQWKLDANRNKTKIIDFGSGGHTLDYDIKFNDKISETIGKYKYLGVSFNSNGKFSREQ